MLVILMENQILPPQQVCQSCLMADQSGQPRWHQGQLRCGRALRKGTIDQPEQYECQMGFRIAHIE
ncbi:MAG: hypothetical protein IGS50_19490 [Synechococcales cyanobacterium C42_A2020_086]|jgi:hypothetical protein|nr:hypothetical protein [Synechococcales cyanobacterium C42_A2020_086]